MKLTHVCWSRDVYSNPSMPHIGTGCMATKLPRNTTAWKWQSHTSAASIASTRVLYVRIVCVCMFFPFVTFHVCSITGQTRGNVSPLRIQKLTSKHVVQWSQLQFVMGNLISLTLPKLAHICHNLDYRSQVRQSSQSFQSKNDRACMPEYRRLRSWLQGISGVMHK